MDIQQILIDRHIVRIDPEIVGGVSVFIGTRVPLQTLFDYLEGEEGLNEFLEDFPHLRTSALQVLETKVNSLALAQACLWHSLPKVIDS
jgi:uncharacterized protein (DUF433 family)